ncbi:MAG: pyridoxamine 5'-phosphate oxidase family protein [Planctomycetes bacterium]|nr:pyridoxamine 5'-phosphate oxidase family protein [Planctomycetota bacterium]
MDDLRELARSFLDRRTAVAFLSSVGSKGRSDVAVLAAARFAPDGSLAGGEEDGVGGATFRNLRQNPLASLLVLDPVADPRARDGVRLQLEFLGAESDGDELARLDAWLQSFAPGRRMVRRLLFKVLSIERFRAPAPATIASAPGAAG